MLLSRLVDQVVDDADPVAVSEQIVSHVAADEAGAAGDDGYGFCAHLTPSRFMRLTL